MDIILVAFGMLSLAVVIFAILAAIAVKKWVFPVSKTALETYWSERWNAIDERLREIEEDLGRLPRMWEEFASDAKKAQERARWHVRRVQKELGKLGLSDAEIDTISSDLRQFDAEGGGEEGVLPLHDAVAEDAPPEEDPITRALRRKWGSQ